MRLRVPERRQITMVVQSPDDLVPAQHPVRMGMALVEILDLTRFSEPSKAFAKAADGIAMRQQVEQRSGGKVEQHLLDGGYLRMADLEQAQPQGVERFVPPKPARHAHHDKAAVRSKAMARRQRRLALETWPARPAPDRRIVIRSTAPPESWLLGTETDLVTASERSRRVPLW